MIIAVDFDGTCVTHDYPDVGKDAPGCVEALLELQKRGHRFILWTMRSTYTLDAAVKWFHSRGISLMGINENPEQSTWTSSPKVYANFYIDDAAAGCPLIDVGHPRPVVDWKRVLATIPKYPR